MAKVQIKSEKITPFGGIFHVRELFSRFVGPVIDKVLGLRCTSFGYQYGEIVGSLSSVYFCGGDCVEDVTSHLMPHLSLHPTLRTCSSDTILRAISELATGNTTYTSDTGKSYEFNPATKLNTWASSCPSSRPTVPCSASPSSASRRITTCCSPWSMPSPPPSASVWR